MRNKRILLAALALVVCVLVLCVCTNKPVKGDNSDDMPLAVLYAKEGKSMPVLGDGFDTADIFRIIYSRDGYDDVETDDPELIKALISGLREIKVTGEYKDDLYATDSASAISFYTQAGGSCTVRFDFGNLSVGQKLYTVASDKQFRDAVNSLLLKYGDQ